MIEYISSDIWKAKPESFIVSSNNCQGTWGSGFAQQMRQRFPKSYNKFQNICLQHKSNKTTKNSLLGTFSIFKDIDRFRKIYYNLVCLYTSEYYGTYKDPEEMILLNTEKSIRSLLDFINFYNSKSENKIMELYSPKINSGLFKVEWSKTEKIIEQLLSEKNPDLRWIVCSDV